MRAMKQYKLSSGNTGGAEGQVQVNIPDDAIDDLALVNHKYNLTEDTGYRDESGQPLTFEIDVNLIIRINRLK